MPLVANVDLTLHRDMGIPPDPGSGFVEVTAFTVPAGEEVPVKELVKYQQDALKDKDSFLASNVRDVSQAEYDAAKALREDAAAEKVAEDEGHVAPKSKVTHVEAPPEEA